MKKPRRDMPGTWWDLVEYVDKQDAEIRRLRSLLDSHIAANRELLEAKRAVEAALREANRES